MTEKESVPSETDSNLYNNMVKTWEQIVACQKDPQACLCNDPSFLTAPASGLQFCSSEDLPKPQLNGYTGPLWCQTTNGEDQGSVCSNCYFVGTSIGGKDGYPFVSFNADDNELIKRGRVEGIYQDQTFGDLEIFKVQPNPSDYRIGTEPPGEITGDSAYNQNIVFCSGYNKGTTNYQSFNLTGAPGNEIGKNDSPYFSNQPTASTTPDSVNLGFDIQ